MNKLKILSLFIALFIGTFLYGAASDQTENPNYRLLAAIFNGDVDAARQALENGADIHQKPITPIMIAATRGEANIVALLLDHGVDINGQDPMGMTALAQAAYAGHTNVVDLLIQRGANLNVQDRLAMTPLMIAAEVGRQAIVERLLAAGADSLLRNIYEQRAIDLARSAGHAGIVALLKKYLPNRLAFGA